jgi:hypothetical protein
MQEIAYKINARYSDLDSKDRQSCRQRAGQILHFPNFRHVRHPNGAVSWFFWKIFTPWHPICSASQLSAAFRRDFRIGSGGSGALEALRPKGWSHRVLTIQPDLETVPTSRTQNDKHSPLI